MSYKSILVNINIDGPVAPIVKAGLDLAQRFQATLTGFCAADVPMPVTFPEGADLGMQIWEDMREETEKRIKTLRTEFEQLVADSVKTAWRGGLGNPTDGLVATSKLADVVVMAAPDGASSGNAYRVAEPAGAVLRAGRPLLIVANRAEQINTKKILIAWKDTREARRAVADSVPLLSRAKEVTVVTAASEIDSYIREGVKDVIAYLAAHHIEAKSELIESPDETDALFGFINEMGPDLVVSGAYGHSRLREWAFGGMTRSLLDEISLNRFVSN